MYLVLSYGYENSPTLCCNLSYAYYGIFAMPIADNVSKSSYYMFVKTIVPSLHCCCQRKTTSLLKGCAASAHDASAKAGEENCNSLKSKTVTRPPTYAQHKAALIWEDNPSNSGCDRFISGLSTPDLCSISVLPQKVRLPSRRDDGDRSCSRQSGRPPPCPSLCC